MASKRMFSKTITNSARFLKMPVDSQSLYFHLCMNADDDGIVEAYSVLKITGSSEDNLRVLSAKSFIRVLNEDLVSHIVDWNEHNLIRADRKIDSIYKDLLLQIVPEIELIEPKPRADTGKITGRTMDSVGKVRLGKVRLDQDSIDIEQFEKEDAEYYKISDGFEQFWNLYDKKIEREKCFKRWKKIKPDTYPIIFDHVERYVKSTPDKQYRKNPETYLNNCCWNDEILSKDNISKFTNLSAAEETRKRLSGEL